MSIENEKTVEVYNQKASTYNLTTKESEKLQPEVAKLKREKLERLIKEYFGRLPKGSKIFEIGSCDGIDAKYISNLGFNVTASSTADDFINETKKLIPNTIKFDAIKDDFKEKYMGVFCWRVFVHFTKEDAKIVIKKVYDALEKNGIFIFNVMNRERKSVDNEWIDFEGVYHMGAKRYYNYFMQNELDDIISKTSFKIEYFKKEGDNDKWLVYVLKKA